MDITKTVQLRPGRYVVAVSGGVDSMSLLHLLLSKYPPAPKAKKTSRVLKDNDLDGIADAKDPLKVASKMDHHFIVAHFDHGIRPDSHLDKKLIQDVADRHGLPFVYAKGELGPKVSEAAARRARYAFLRKVKQQAGADSIITAHHFDDWMETAVHNMLRGTGRKGLSSLHNREDIIRPLMHLPKDKLRDYAASEGLVWREDSTNKETKYRRNYIRLKILPDLKQRSPRDYEKLKVLVRRQAELNRAIDQRLTHLLHYQPEASAIDRNSLIMLPHNVSKELVAHWLRLAGRAPFQRRQLEVLVRGLKTARPGSKLVVGPKHYFDITKKSVSLHSDR